MKLLRLLQHLHQTGQEACPIDFRGQGCAKVDLSRTNQALAHWPASPGPLLDGYIQAEMVGHKTAFLWGGYAEDRDVYRLSPNFHTSADPRSIHLGIDIWAKAGTPVWAALPGVIHSVADNAGLGNYGGTIIVAHGVAGLGFCSLYGHLSLHSLAGWQPGQAVQAGQRLAELGQPTENGGWSPHLHFQIIEDLLGRYGDFPGVAAKAEQAHYLAICPDPDLLLGLSAKAGG